MDIYGKNKGNISLPSRLQPSDYDNRLENVIANTQTRFYKLKISEINKRIQRLEDQNKELVINLKNTDHSIKTLQEEKIHEISNLNSQVTSHIARVEEYKKQLIAAEKSRIEDKFAHIDKTINIDEKYKNRRIMLMSQIKLLNAKTNVLQDYKVMQYALETKLNIRNRSLFSEREQVAENLQQIERKFKIDREKLKTELCKRLLGIAETFQLQVTRDEPCSISKLLSEKIAINNKLKRITEAETLKEWNYIEQKNILKELKKKINRAHLTAERSIVINKLEKSVNAMLHKIRNKADVYLSKLDKPDHLTEEQYIMNKDSAKKKTQKCETCVEHLQVLLYCEKEKLTVAKIWSHWLSTQSQIYLQVLYDIKLVLTNLKSENKMNK